MVESLCGYSMRVMLFLRLSASTVFNDPAFGNGSNNGIVQQFLLFKDLINIGIVDFSSRKQVLTGKKAQGDVFRDTDALFGKEERSGNKQEEYR